MNREAVIQALNRLLDAEFMALEYYRVHADALADDDIASAVRAIIPVEDAHAVTLATRISELGGTPMLPGSEASEKGRQMAETSMREGTRAMLRLELRGEQEAIKSYAEALADVEEDMITVDLLEEQLLDEMRHARWLKQTLLRLKNT